MRSLLLALHCGYCISFCSMSEEHMKYNISVNQFTYNAFWEFRFSQCLNIRPTPRRDYFTLYLLLTDASSLKSYEVLFRRTKDAIITSSECRLYTYITYTHGHEHRWHKKVYLQGVRYEKNGYNGIWMMRHDRMDVVSRLPVGMVGRYCLVTPSKNINYFILIGLNL